MAVSVAATSAATGPSDVPAVRTTTFPRLRQPTDERAPGLPSMTASGQRAQHGRGGLVVHAGRQGQRAPPSSSPSEAGDGLVGVLPAA